MGPAKHASGGKGGCGGDGGGDGDGVGGVGVGVAAASASRRRRRRRRRCWRQQQQWKSRAVVVVVVDDGERPPGVRAGARAWTAAKAGGVMRRKSGRCRAHPHFLHLAGCQHLRAAAGGV